MCRGASERLLPDVADAGRKPERDDDILLPHVVHPLGRSRRAPIPRPTTSSAIRRVAWARPRGLAHAVLRFRRRFRLCGRGDTLRLGVVVAAVFLCLRLYGVGGNDAVYVGGVLHEGRHQVDRHTSEVEVADVPVHEQRAVAVPCWAGAQRGCLEEEAGPRGQLVPDGGVEAGGAAPALRAVDDAEDVHAVLNAELVATVHRQSGHIPEKREAAATL